MSIEQYRMNERCEVVRMTEPCPNPDCPGVGCAVCKQVSVVFICGTGDFPNFSTAGPAPASTALKTGDRCGMCGFLVRASEPIGKGLWAECNCPENRDDNVTALSIDTVVVEELERRGVQSICFRDGSQINPGSMSLRAVFATAIPQLGTQGR